jgi:hypothetical protein
MPKQKQDNSVKNKPVVNWRASNFVLAVWENKQEFNGNEVCYKTMTLTRTFKKKEEEIWRSEFINNIRRNDLQKIEVLMRKAQDYLYFENTDGGDKDE